MERKPSMKRSGSGVKTKPKSMKQLLMAKQHQQLQQRRETNVAVQEEAKASGKPVPSGQELKRTQSGVSIPSIQAQQQLRVQQQQQKQQLQRPKPQPKSSEQPSDVKTEPRPQPVSSPTPQVEENERKNPTSKPSQESQQSTVDTPQPASTPKQPEQIKPEPETKPKPPPPPTQPELQADPSVAALTDMAVDDEAVSPARRFFHGLGRCPDPPDGETPYFKAATQLIEVDVNLNEAEDTVTDYVTFCKDLYSTRTDNPLVYEWNDAIQQFYETTFASWQKTQSWSDLNGVVKRFHAGAIDKCLPVVKGLIKSTRAKAIGAFRKVGTGSFCHESAGLFVHVWHSSTQARRFMSAFTRLSQATLEHRIGMIYSPLSVIGFYKGHHYTVTAAAPLLRNDPMDINSSPGNAMLGSFANKLRGALGTPMETPLPLYKGGDGRFYCLCVEALMAVHVSQPEKAAQFSARYEALKYILPRMAIAVRDKQTVADRRREADAASPTGGADDLPVLDTNTSSPVAAGRMLRRRSTVALMKSVAPPILSSKEVMSILMETAIPNCAADMLEEALACGEDSEAPTVAQLTRINLLQRAMRKHGVNTRFIYHLLTVAPFDPKPANASPNVYQTIDSLRSIIIVEMIRRTLKVMVKGLIYTHAQEDQTDAQSANRANWLLALCGSSTNGVWKKHFFAVLRAKFNAPKTLLVGYSDALISQCAMYISARLGIVYDEGTKRFVGFKQVTYPFGFNSTALLFFCREAFESYVIKYNEAQEKLMKLRVAAAAFETKDKTKFAVRKAQMIFKKGLKKKENLVEGTANEDEGFATATGDTNKDEPSKQEGDDPNNNDLLDAPPATAHNFVALGLRRRLEELQRLFATITKVSRTFKSREESHVVMAANTYSHAVLTRINTLVAMSLPLLITPTISGNTVVFWQRTQSEEDRAVLTKTIAFLEDRLLPTLEGSASGSAPLSMELAASSSVVVDVSLALQRELLILADENHVDENGAKASKVDQVTGEAVDPILGDGLPKDSIVMLDEHLASIKKVTSAINMWHIGLRLRMLGRTLARPDIIAEGAKRMPRAPHVDRSIFTTYFSVLIESGRGLANLIAKGAKGYGTPRDLIDVIHSAADDCDSGPGQETYRRRGFVLQIMRTVTKQLVSSHDAKMCHDLKGICEESFKWHIHRYGFDDVQSSVAIVQFVFVAMYAHLPELSHQQEERLNMYRFAISSLGTMRPSEVRQLLGSEQFLSLLSDVVAMMSDVRDWSAAQIIADEAEHFGSVKKMKEMEQEQNEAEASRPAAPVAGDIQGFLGAARRAKLESEQQEEQSRHNSTHDLESMSLDNQAAQLYAERTEGADDLMSDEELQAATKQEEESIRAMNEARHALMKHQEALQESQADFDHDLAAELAHKAATEGLPVGDALVAIVRKQVLNDFQMQLNELQMEEEAARRPLRRTHGHVQLFPDYFEELIEREVLRREEILEQESNERIRCPGCMEAHLYLLAMAEKAKERSVQRQESKDQSVENKLDALERRQKVAQQWKNIRHDIMAEVQKEQEDNLKRAQLQTNEGFERRQILDEERNAIRALKSLKHQHLSAIERHERLIERLQNEREETERQVVVLHNQRLNVLEGKEDSARALLIDMESRRWETAILARAENGRRSIQRVEVAAEEAAAKAAAVAKNIAAANDSAWEKELRQLEALERKFEQANAQRQEKQRLMAERERDRAAAEAGMSSDSVLQRKLGAILNKEAAERRNMLKEEEKKFSVIHARHSRHSVYVAYHQSQEVVDYEAEDAVENDPQMDKLTKMEEDLLEKHTAAEVIRRGRRTTQAEDMAEARQQRLDVAARRLGVCHQKEEVARRHLIRHQERSYNVLQDKWTSLLEGFRVLQEEEAKAAALQASRQGEASPRRQMGQDDDADSGDGDAPMSPQQTTAQQAVASVTERKKEHADEQRAARRKLLEEIEQNRIEAMQEILDYKRKSIFTREVSCRRNIMEQQEQTWAIILGRLDEKIRDLSAEEQEAESDETRVNDDISVAKAQHNKRVETLSRFEEQLLAKMEEVTAVRRQAEAAAQLKNAMNGELHRMRHQRQLEKLTRLEMSERSKLVFEYEKKSKVIMTRYSRLQILTDAEIAAEEETFEEELRRDTKEHSMTGDEKVHRIIAAANTMKAMKKLTAAQRMRADAKRLREEAIEKQRQEDAVAAAARRLTEMVSSEETARRTVVMEATFQREVLRTSFEKGRSKIEKAVNARREKLEQEEQALIRRLEKRAAQRQQAQRKLQMTHEQLERQREEEERLEREKEEAEAFEEKRRKKYADEKVEREKVRTKTVQQIMVMMAQKKAERAEQRLEMQRARQHSSMASPVDPSSPNSKHQLLSPVKLAPLDNAPSPPPAASSPAPQSASARGGSTSPAPLDHHDLPVALKHPTPSRRKSIGDTQRHVEL